MRKSAFAEMRKLACPQRLAGAVSDLERTRSGVGAGSIGTAAQRFRKVELRRSILVRSGADFVAGAALSQGQLFSRFELRGRRSTFESSGADFVAGAALSQGQVQISWQAQHFRKVKCQIRGRRSTFAISKMKKLQKAWPCARIGVCGDAKASLSAASGWSDLGTGLERGRRRVHWHGNTEVSQGLNCVAAFW